MEQVKQRIAVLRSGYIVMRKSSLMAKADQAEKIIAGLIDLAEELAEEIEILKNPPPAWIGEGLSHE